MLRAGLLLLALAVPAGAQQEIMVLDPAARRGATAEERARVSDPTHAEQALAGVWEWGSFRIVVAEDLFNCLPSGHCPFALLDRWGGPVLTGLALERPALAGGGLIWRRPDGRVMRANPLER